MKYTKISFLLFVFVNVSQAMEISPLWESARRDALSCARNIIDISPLWESARKNALICATKDQTLSVSKPESQLIHENRLKRSDFYRKIDKARTIEDIVCLMRQQAQIAMTLARNKGQRVVLQEVIKKAQPGITTNNMNYCLVNLEYFFTHSTKNYEKIRTRMTLNSVKLLLSDNIVAYNNSHNVQLLP